MAIQDELHLEVPSYIQSLIPYLPGKPIEEAKRELGLSRVIKLASNENPLGPSPRAMAAYKKCLSSLHRYPDGGAFRLKHALSEKLEVTPQQLLIGNGSNEIIDLMIRTYCVPGDAIVTSQAAFIAYRLCAQIHGVSSLETPLDEALRFDLPAMAEMVRSNERTKIVFIPNPNNPTGTYVTGDELREFLREMAVVSKERRSAVLVALDYAYWEYVTAKDLPDPMELMREFSHVVVLRTFSKIYGLAGLRIGYGVGDARVMSAMEKVRQPFNVTAPGLAAAEAALSDSSFVARSRRANQTGMLFWEKTLKKLGIPFWKSQGNFILADVGRGLGRRGGEVYEACLKRGVIFRPVTNYGLAHALRISIGLPEENRIAARALEGELPDKKWKQEKKRRARK